MWLEEEEEGGEGGGSLVELDAELQVSAAHLLMTNNCEIDPKKILTVKASIFLFLLTLGSRPTVACWIFFNQLRSSFGS